jgi:hypothetical protein
MGMRAGISGAAVTGNAVTGNDAGAVLPRLGVTGPTADPTPIPMANVIAASRKPVGARGLDKSLG